MHPGKKAKKVQISSAGAGQTDVISLWKRFQTLSQQIEAADDANDYGLALALSNQARKIIEDKQELDEVPLDYSRNICEIDRGQSYFLAKLGRHKEALEGFKKVIATIEVNPRKYADILPPLTEILKAEMNYLKLKTHQLSQYFTAYEQCFNQAQLLTLKAQSSPILTPPLPVNAASTTSLPATSTTTRIDVLTVVAETMLKVHPTQKGAGHSK